MLGGDKLWAGKKVIKPVREAFSEVTTHEETAKITKIYTNVSTKNLSTIKNPFDSILKGNET